MSEEKPVRMMDHLRRQHGQKERLAIKAPPRSPAYIAPDDPGEPAERDPINIHLPKYLILELKQVGVERSCSTAFLITEALKIAGYGVSEADLIPDRRRKR